MGLISLSWVKRDGDFRIKGPCSHSVLTETPIKNNKFLIDITFQLVYVFSLFMAFDISSLHFGSTELMKCHDNQDEPAIEQSTAVLFHIRNIDIK